MSITIEYPKNLSPALLKAAQMVCEGGVSRAYASRINGVDAVELGLVLRNAGLRRAPPSAVQIALQSFDNGETLKQAAHSAKIATRTLQFWLWRREKTVPADSPALRAVNEGIPLGLTGYEAAERYGAQYPVVMRTAAILGKRFPKKSRVNTTKDVSIINRWKELRSMRKTGKEFGLTGARVHQIIKRNGGVDNV